MANEKRLIDANALMKSIRSFRWFGTPNTLKLMFEYLWLIIRDEPAVEAVEVVRCKDCRWRNTKGCSYRNFKAAERDDDDFCSDGERKDNV